MMCRVSNNYAVSANYAMSAMDVTMANNAHVSNGCKLTILNFVWRQRDDFLMPAADEIPEEEEEGVAKPPVWEPPERAMERWSALVEEAATPRPWNTAAMLGLRVYTTKHQNMSRNNTQDKEFLAIE